MADQVAPLLDLSMIDFGMNTKPNAPPAQNGQNAAPNNSFPSGKRRRLYFWWKRTCDDFCSSHASVPFFSWCFLSRTPAANKKPMNGGDEGDFAAFPIGNQANPPAQPLSAGGPNFVKQPSFDVFGMSSPASNANPPPISVATNGASNSKNVLP